MIRNHIKVGVPFDWQGLNTPDEWIAELTKARDSVPAEYHADLVVDVQAEIDYDCAYSEIEIYYLRIETVEEAGAREAKIREDRTRQIRHLEEQLTKLKS